MLQFQFQLNNYENKSYFLTQVKIKCLSKHLITDFSSVGYRNIFQHLNVNALHDTRSP